jgi:hypothetical protein
MSSINKEKMEELINSFTDEDWEVVLLNAPSNKIFPVLYQRFNDMENKINTIKNITSREHQM